MGTLPNRFIATAIVFALAGMAFGIVMGIRQEFSLATVHAHWNLLGWVSMTLFGLVYKAYGTEEARGRIAAHYWVALAGNVGMPAGVLIAITRGQPGVAIAGSLITVLSMLLFLSNFLKLRRPKVAA